jgi:hypothetical protein
LRDDGETGARDDDCNNQEHSRGHPAPRIPNPEPLIPSSCPYSVLKFTVTFICTSIGMQFSSVGV